MVNVHCWKKQQLDKDSLGWFSVSPGSNLAGIGSDCWPCVIGQVLFFSEHKQAEISRTLLHIFPFVLHRTVNYFW